MKLNKEMQFILDNRIKELLNNTEVLNLFNSFDTEEEAQFWITKQAIATLIGVYK